MGVPLQNSPVCEDGSLVRRAQAGDPEALSALRGQYHSQLAAILVMRGASLTETEDVLADLWADCVPDGGDRPSLLQKFSGKSPLLAWLVRVARNRLIDLKRRGSRQAILEEDDLDLLPGCPTELVEDQLLALLRESIQLAFASCPGEALVMLRLVHMHDLTQREVGKLFGRSEATVSRTLEAAMDHIRTRTLQELRRRDARLELAWEDFLGLCAGDEPVFS